jgi:2-methylcitrate dehydratase PrpD
MIPAVLAVAEAQRASGRAVIAAMVAAYEVFCRLADEVPLKGWDQGMFAAVGAACGSGKILGLDRPQMGHAMSPSTPSSRAWPSPLPVRATRARARRGSRAARLAGRRASPELARGQASALGEGPERQADDLRVTDSTRNRISSGGRGRAPT